MNNEGLETITKEIEYMKQSQKEKLDQYDLAIAKLVEKKKQFLDKAQQEIDAALVIQRQLLGDEELVETQSFIVSKKYPDFTKPVSYKLQLPKEKEQKDALIQYLRNEQPELVKEKVEYSPVQNEFKKRIAAQVFRLTEEGELVDENGQLIPELTVEVKDVEVKVKVKKG